MAFYYQIVSQTPIRDLAVIWIREGGKVADIRPVIAQAVLKHIHEDPDDDCFSSGFIACYPGDYMEIDIVGCPYAFPGAKLDVYYVLPCSLDQWRDLFKSDKYKAKIAQILGSEYLDLQLTEWTHGPMFS